MASSTEEQTVLESPTEIELRTDRTPTVPGAPTTKTALEHFREYERERPGVVALWCLGLGFVLGWKLKLW